MNPLRKSPILVLALLAGCAGPGGYFDRADAPPSTAAFTLESWPHRELWTGVVFNGEKIGFTRRTVRPADDAPGRYDIDSEAVLRLRFLGIDKRINLRAADRVRADLTLERFSYEHEIDGSPLKARGSSDGRTLEFTIQASGSQEQKKFTLDRPIYPSSALTLLPAVRGLTVGRKDRFLVFEGETQTVTEAEQDVLAFERSQLFEGAAFKLVTRMLGLETTTWVAADGRPVFELAMQGVLISALEDESAARRYLVEASLNKKDSLVDFSLVRSPPIEAPRQVSKLEITLEGMPATFETPGACRRDGDRLACVLDSSAADGKEDSARYLKATLAAPSNLGVISKLARSIAKEGTVDQQIERLLAWMDENIAKEAIDAFSALDVLQSRRGECQGHAYLFAAFARSLGIPTRVVNGLVYSEPHAGFLYHTWNEAWVGGGWRPVDATFGQPRADATHIKLIEGETPAELLPLVGLVGRLRVVSVSPTARW